ncbi:hypothetical protein K8S17_00325, partial [bacterium]|nr:hypothetical protein [bacterium]
DGTAAVGVAGDEKSTSVGSETSVGPAASVGSPASVESTARDDEETVLTARMIEIRPEQDTITALGDARITRGDVRGESRIILISGADESMLLAGDPVVDYGTERLSGEEIFIYASDEEISRLLAAGSARLTYELEAGPGEQPESGYVAGDTLTLFFADGNPTLLTVRGEAESGHVIGTKGERNTVHAPEVDVRFVDGRISRATFRRGASGTYWMLPEKERSRRDGLALADTAFAGGDVIPLVPGPPDTVRLDRIGYAAEQLDYYVGRNRMLLSGAASAEYKDTVLTADRVTFDPENKLLTAEGSPDLQEKGDRLVGDALGYDMEAHAGAVEEGVTTFEDGIYYGDRIVREKDGTLRAWNGVYTTCWAPTPHYRIEAGRMKIYLDDKVVAKPVVIYIGEIPVFALPF